MLFPVASREMRLAATHGCTGRIAAFGALEGGVAEAEAQAPPYEATRLLPGALIHHELQGSEEAARCTVEPALKKARASPAGERLWLQSILFFVARAPAWTSVLSPPLSLK